MCVNILLTEADVWRESSKLSLSNRKIRWEQKWNLWQSHWRDMANIYIHTHFFFWRKQKYSDCFIVTFSKTRLVIFASRLLFIYFTYLIFLLIEICEFVKQPKSKFYGGIQGEKIKSVCKMNKKNVDHKKRYLYYQWIEYVLLALYIFFSVFKFCNQIFVLFAFFYITIDSAIFEYVYNSPIGSVFC